MYGTLEGKLVDIFTRTPKEVTISKGKCMATEVVLLLFVVFFFLGQSPRAICQEFAVGIGPGISLDGNFYHFYDNKFSDHDGRTRIREGLSFGPFITIKSSKKWHFDFGYNRTIKDYAPKRLFSFGTLETVEIKSIELTVSAHYAITEPTRLWQKYVYLGIDYEHEYYLRTRYSNHNGFEFLTPKDYLMSTVGIGLGRFLNEKKNWLFRPELSFRVLTAGSEYLHPFIHKMSLRIKMEYRILG